MNISKLIKDNFAVRVKSCMRLIIKWYKYYSAIGMLVGEYDPIKDRLLNGMVRR